jgi:hypothetical protein
LCEPSADLTVDVRVNWRTNRKQMSDLRWNQTRNLALAAAILGLAASAWAKDAINASVSQPLTGQTPAIAVNGNPYSPGTYAVGTIQLFYTVNAFQFTAGPFASFQLNLQDVQTSTSGPTPSYPVTLNLNQIGSQNLVFTPAPGSFPVTGPGWSAASTISIAIANSVPLNPALNTDGTDLVGNLQLSVAPQGSHLDTVTNVQVHIRLVHPTSCLKLYDFVTSQDMANAVTTLEVTLFKNGPKAGKVQGTKPYSQLSNNVLVVNTCPSAQTFDLAINPDSDFSGTPNPNGNSVFTYTKVGSTDPLTFNISDFGNGTPHGTIYCLGSLTLSGGNSLLAAVHTSISEVSGSSLPSNSIFNFSASLRAAGAGCTGALMPAIPNPASQAIPFTVSQ